MSQSQFEVKAKKDVSGFILDKTTQNPVEFATVSVFQISDLSLVGGAISNHKGKFNLSLSPGKYELQIQFLTYKSKTLQITITRDDPNRINLGGLVLEQDTKELGT